MPSRALCIVLLAALATLVSEAPGYDAPDADRDFDRSALDAAAPGDRIHVPGVERAYELEVIRTSRRSGGGRLVRARTDTGDDVIIARHGRAVVMYMVGRRGLEVVRSPRAGDLRRPDLRDDFSCAVEGGLELPAGGPASPGPECPDDGSIVDVLVVYAAPVIEFFGDEDATRAEIDAMIELSNLAFEASDVVTRYRLAMAVCVEDESTSLYALTNPNDGVHDIVHPWRDLVGADQVVLLSPFSGGVANGLTALEPEQESRMFCVAGVEFSPLVFTHELGHNMGCCHALGDGGGCGIGLLFDYSNGWRWDGDSGTQWRTVMAYSPGEWLPRLSNPLIEHDGAPTGTASADNALTVNLSAPLVATFRCSSESPCGDLTIPESLADCNQNALPDGCDIGLGLSSDLDGNGIPDECEDCNGNGVPDALDISSGASVDCDGDGHPDSCQTDRFAPVLAGGVALLAGDDEIVFTLEAPPAPTGDGVVTIVGHGDYDGPHEWLAVRVGARFVGRAFETDGGNCVDPPQTAAFDVSRELIESVIADGAPLTLSFRTTPFVDEAACFPPPFFRYEFRYPRVRADDLNLDGIVDTCGCLADLDGDGEVGTSDVVHVLSAWGPCAACPEDLDGSGLVDFADVLRVLELWGACP